MAIDNGKLSCTILVQVCIICTLAGLKSYKTTSGLGPRRDGSGHSYCIHSFDGGAVAQTCPCIQSIKKLKSKTFKGTTVHKSNQSLKRTLKTRFKLMPILAFIFGMPMAYSEEEEIIEEQIVVGDLNSLPGESVDSIFGFGKSILETPRSASTIR